MLEGLGESLMTGGLFTIFLSVLIVVVLAIIITIYFKLLYKRVAYNAPSTLKRAFAFIFDMIQINFIVVISSLVYFVATGTIFERARAYAIKLNNQEEFNYYAGKDTLKEDFNEFQMYMVIIFAILSVVYELAGKPTPGKKFMGIVLHADEKPEIWQILVRNILKIPVIAMWPFFLTNFMDEQKQEMAS
jgi:hypothetical protein